MTALVCGLTDEAPVSLLIQALERIGADFLVLDEAALATTAALRWQITDAGVAGHLKVGDTVLDLREIHSVYHRLVDIELLSGPSLPPEEARRTRSLLYSLMSLFDVLPARIVNRRRPMMSNNSKPYQALLIRRAGFAVPETLITNDPTALVEFASHDPLIFKSISSERSIVTALDVAAAARLGSLRNLPTQFQHKIEGFNVRVHVIGRQLFATRIVTTATDYRYAGPQGTWVQFTPYELTADLRNCCLHLARACELAFCGIDLMIAPGEVYCLEVNPAPAYSYYQEATGQPISIALAELLARDERKQKGGARRAGARKICPRPTS